MEIFGWAGGLGPVCVCVCVCVCVQALKDRNHHMERVVDQERGERVAMAAALEERKVAVSGEQAELSRCRAQLEQERHQVAELYSLHNPGDQGHIRQLLENARLHKEEAQLHASKLQDQLSHTRTEVSHLQGTLSKVATHSLTHSLTHPLTHAPKSATCRARSAR